MPTGSKTDPLLEKIKPISDSVDMSGIKDLRRGELSSSEQKLPEREVRIFERISYEDSNISEGGSRCSPGTAAEILLQPMEVHGGAESHVEACGSPHIRTGACIEEAVTP
ncbi:hypothetical protein DUI87_16845 [Hirundo rustica rustica]|uniref:Uncharacterized protein n=1 Tax=Hirundo rustica rustica TaxID=333673 RepID=A0A3M0K8K4_HIRRU|nr:hypothetical protein DUI87_16845 [Hirundo rustica rustica]